MQLACRLLFIAAAMFGGAAKLYRTHSERNLIYAFGCFNVGGVDCTALEKAHALTAD